MLARGTEAREEWTTMDKKGLMVAVFLLAGVGACWYAVSRTSDRGRQDQAEAQARYQERVEQAVKAKQVFVGMLADDVARSLGKPERVNRTSTAAGTREQWIFFGGHLYVYLDDGIVTATQSVGRY